MACKHPILFLIYNRPDCTEQVFRRIRKVQPSRLFIAADGPRSEDPDDIKRCKEARRIVQRVDWPCEINTLFRDNNLGCKQAVSEAVSWFFQSVDAGIILEDDCVPNVTFFRYCDELLNRYADDERIMAVSGDNFQSKEFECEYSYYFSAYSHCWGWATWRRAWQYYDGELSEWTRLRRTGWLRGWLGSTDAANYWTDIFDRVADNKVDSWAYPWTFACWRQHALTVLPSVNLVQNIGTGELATHPQGTRGRRALHKSVESLGFPLRHPESVVRDYDADRYTEESHFGVGRLRQWKRTLRECGSRLGLDVW